LTNNGNSKPVWLKNKEEIIEYFNFTPTLFRVFYECGMPVITVNGKYMGHRENIEIWLKNASKQQIDIDELRNGQKHI
jgi:hypothetical protein